MGSRAKHALLVCLVIALGSIVTACGGGGDSGGQADINWYVFNEPGGGYDAAVANCNKENRGRFRINYVKLPTDADQQRELIVRRLAAKDSDIGVVGMDVNWTAEFAEAGWIEPWEGANRDAATEDRIPALLQAVEYEDKVWAAPFTTNTQLLWYHKDVLGDRPVPKTWDEMIDTAKDIGGAEGKVVVQGRRYEGLVVWFNSLVASGGGEIITEEGDVRLTAEPGSPGVKAATIMKRVATEAGTTTVSSDKEDTGNDAFQGGNLAFMVNYPFVYASVAEDKEAAANLGYARYPSVDPGRPSRVTFGGINLGVSSYAKNKELAFEAAKCLAASPQQKVAALKGGLFPTRQSLFEDGEIREAYPFADLVEQTLADGVPRPVLPAYSDISLAIQDKLHPPGDIEPVSAIEDLRDALEKAKEGKLF
jgi:multiple sugar transport system substrate-binding protein